MTARFTFHLKPEQPSTLSAIVAFAAEIGEFLGQNQLLMEVTSTEWGIITARTNDEASATLFKFRFSDRFVTLSPRPEKDASSNIVFSVAKSRPRCPDSFRFMLDVAMGVGMDEASNRYTVAEP